LNIKLMHDQQSTYHCSAFSVLANVFYYSAMYFAGTQFNLVLVLLELIYLENAYALIRQEMIIQITDNR